jgi:hypothetical protein
VTELALLLGHSNDIKTNSDTGADSALKLLLINWMTLHSKWTEVEQEKNIFVCRCYRNGG